MRVELLGVPRERAGVAEVELQADTLGGLLAALAVRFPLLGELIAEAQLITNWEANAFEVAQLIHPHPTLSEALGEAHLALAGKPLHSP